MQKDANTRQKKGTAIREVENGLTPKSLLAKEFDVPLCQLILKIEKTFSNELLRRVKKKG